MIDRVKLTAISLFVLGIVLEGGLLSGWWPTGWPQPLVLTIILTTVWWLSLPWHTVLILGSALVVDSLQGSGNFGLTRLTCLIVALNLIIQLMRGAKAHPPLNWRLVVLGWLSLYPIWQLMHHFDSLTWRAASVVLMEVAVGGVVWWWVMSRVERSSLQ